MPVATASHTAKRRSRKPARVAVPARRATPDATAPSSEGWQTANLDVAYFGPTEGGWIRLGHEKPARPVPMELFGPPKFSPDDQAAHPDQPMTRVVKDVLPVGRWKFGRDRRTGNVRFGNVTPDMLTTLASQFRLAQSRGVALNLGKTHGDLMTGLIHPDDLIAPIDEAVTDGHCLWIACYVTPEQAAYLCNPARKVSAGLRWNWSDGQGHVYPIQMVHVAVTDQPVVSGQGAFVALANLDNTNLSQGDFAMAKPDMAELRELINALLTKLGMNPPADDVDDDVYLEVVKTLVGATASSEGEGSEGDAGAAAAGAAMGGMAKPAAYTASMANDPENPPTGDDAGTGTDGAGTGDGTGGDNPAVSKLTAMLSNMQGQLVKLSNDLGELKTERTNRAKDAFMGKVNALAKACKITPKLVANLTNQGQSSGWNLSLLDGYDDLPGLGGRVARTAGTAKPDPISSEGSADLSDDQIAEGVAAILNRPVTKKKS